MRYLAHTTHSFISDDDTVGVFVEVEEGAMTSLQLALKGGGSVPLSVTEMIELAAVVGQAAQFLAELGYREEAAG